MKILIRNLDSVVIYAQDDLILDNELHGNNWHDLNFNSTNAHIINVDSLPELWAGAVWSYNNEKWKVHDNVRYEALLAKEKTRLDELVKTKIKADIAALEATITPRRTREAILAIDTIWLADVEIKIGQLRQQLAEL
jgi:hypothetical protein